MYHCISNFNELDVTLQYHGFTKRTNEALEEYGMDAENDFGGDIIDGNGDVVGHFYLGDDNPVVEFCDNTNEWDDLVNSPFTYPEEEANEPQN